MRLRLCRVIQAAILLLPFLTGVNAQEIGWITVSKWMDQASCYSLIRLGTEKQYGTGMVPVQVGDTVVPKEGVSLLFSPNRIECKAILIDTLTTLGYPECEEASFLQGVYSFAEQFRATSRTFLKMVVRGDGQAYRREPDTRIFSFPGHGSPLLVSVDSDQVERRVRNIVGAIPNIRFIHEPDEADIVFERRAHGNVVITDTSRKGAGRTTSLDLAENPEPVAAFLWRAMCRKTVVTPNVSTDAEEIAITGDGESEFQIEHIGTRPLFVHLFAVDDSGEAHQVVPESVLSVERLYPGDTIDVRLPISNDRTVSRLILAYSPHLLWFGIPSLGPVNDEEVRCLQEMPMRAVPHSAWRSVIIGMER